MASESFKIEGAAELQKRLKQLPAKIAGGIMRKALRAGAKVILAAAKENAPVGVTGNLKRSLKVRAGKRKKFRISFTVSTRAGDFAGDEFYGAFQEFGWKHGKRKLPNRKQIQGRHYIERAYRERGEAAVNAFVDVLKAGLDAETSK